MLESYIEKKSCDWAKAHDWLVRKCQWVGREGAPDRLFIKRGRFVFIEFKRPGGKPTELQKREHDRLRAAGAECYVCDSIEAAIGVLSADPLI